MLCWPCLAGCREVSLFPCELVIGQSFPHTPMCSSEFHEVGILLTKSKTALCVSKEQLAKSLSLKEAFSLKGIFHNVNYTYIWSSTISHPYYCLGYSLANYKDKISP